MLAVFRPKVRFSAQNGPYKVKRLGRSEKRTFEANNRHNLEATTTETLAVFRPKVRFSAQNGSYKVKRLTSAFSRHKAAFSL